MTPAKLRSSRFALIGTTTIAVVILSGFVGHFFPREPIVKEASALYKVVEVIDGDTIRVEMNNQIEILRLLGIDTPEISSPYTSEECYGRESSEKARELLEDKEVYLIPDPESSDRDKYGRLLRYAFLPGGVFINAELIKGGYAFNYIYEPFQFMKQFDYLEKRAKENRLGLWGEECDYYFEIENK